MPKQSAKQQELRRVSTLECENWNFKHPVGTPVVLRRDCGSSETGFALVETKTRTPAYVADSGHAVCFFEGVSGYYLLERATAKEVQDAD